MKSITTIMTAIGASMTREELPPPGALCCGGDESWVVLGVPGVPALGPTVWSMSALKDAW
jgi:hypothetical protein